MRMDVRKRNSEFKRSEGLTGEHTRQTDAVEVHLTSATGDCMRLQH